MSRKTYLDWDLDQTYLLPPSLRDWLAEDHLVYFVLDVVRSIDLSPIIEAIVQKDPRGQKPYHPVMMVVLLVYGYCTGVFSSRKLERACREDVAFRVLTANAQPHFTTINEFRRVHRPAFSGVFLEILRLCEQAGLVKLGHVAIDGTKIQANASKHKAMSYERMQANEERLKAEIDALLAEAERVDDDEDARYGEGKRAFELPDDLKRRGERLERIRKAKAELEEAARRRRVQDLRAQADNHRHTADSHPQAKVRKAQRTMAERADAKADGLAGDCGRGEGDDGDDDDDAAQGPEPASGGLPPRTMAVTTDGTPKPASQRNFTDPESSIMVGRHGFIQGYNCQAAVDGHRQVIVGADVTNASVDNALLMPMLREVEQACGRLPDATTADTGYWNPEQVGQAKNAGVETYVAVKRVRRSESGPPTRTGEPPDDLSPLEQMRWRLDTKRGRQVYARRKAVVEPVFGQIRVRQTFNRLSFRTLQAVRSEWKLVAACHNLWKLFAQAQQAGATTAA